MTAPTYFRLEFRTSASFESIRAFCADVVRLVQPSTSGDWELTRSVPRPHEGHGSNSALAHTTWELGSAALVQKIDGGDGNPRDGYGFDMSLVCEVTGGDGVTRKLQLTSGSWDPQPNSICPELIGFTPAEFFAIRALGAERFGHDDSANVTWARYNVETLVKCGDRDGVITLAREALPRSDPAWSASSRRFIHRALCDLIDEPEARSAEEGRALRGDPTDVERLARLASGELTLPGWTKAAAQAVLHRMAPWTDPTNPALRHPWWTPAPAQPEHTNWNVAAWQPVTARRIEQRTEYVPDGPPKPLVHPDAVTAAQNQLGVNETVHVGGLSLEVSEAREGVILSLEPEVQVRGMVHRRVRTEATHTVWTWFFTGRGAEGAIIVSRLAAPFDVKAPPLETQVLFVGAPDAQKAKWLEGGRRVLTPVKP